MSVHLRVGKLPFCGALSSLLSSLSRLPSSRKISTGAFAHVNVWYVFLHVRFLPTVYVFSSLSSMFLCFVEHPFCHPTPITRCARADNEKTSPLMIKKGEEDWRWKYLKCGSKFTFLPLLPATMLGLQFHIFHCWWGKRLEV